MGTSKRPWGKTGIKDQSQAEFEAHYRENRAREERKAATRDRKRSQKGGQ